MKRRRALTVAGSSVLLAGCLSTVTDQLSRPEEPDGYVRPDGEPPAVPEPLTCEDPDFERLGEPDTSDDVPWGTVTDDDGEALFELRASATSYEYGETLSVSLVNVSDEPLLSGIRSNYGIQCKTEAGWEDVRGTTLDSPLTFEDEAMEHEPGEGFDWSIQLTESGILDEYLHADEMTVCPDLPEGRYRFKCWDPPIAVAFDLYR